MIIKNAKLITWGSPNKIIPNASIVIKGNRIEEFGEINEKLLINDKDVFDAKGFFVMPGNICAHTHFYGAFARGMSIPGNPAQNFNQILEKLWWPLDKVLDLEDIYYSAMVCIIDAIRHGTTTLFDHHASQRCIPGSLDEIVRAVMETGIRADLCYEVSDREGEKSSKQGIDENIRFIDRIRSEKQMGGMLNAHFGLHAGLTISEKTLKHCRDENPHDVGFHLHAAEAISDEYDSLDKYGKRIITRLDESGRLNQRTIIAHGVHLDERETEILAERKTWISTQPRSNMNNAVGLGNIEGMLGVGVPVCLGNDGFSNSMWEEWKAAYLGHKLWNRDPRSLPADRLTEIAVVNNSKLATQSFNKGTIGKIEKGAQADLIFVEYKPYTELTPGNLPWHIVFGFHESMINSTMVAGKFLMKNRVLTTIDEEKIIHDALEHSKQVWKRYTKIMENGTEK